MAKVRNWSDIQQEITFTEFDYYQRYEGSFGTQKEHYGLRKIAARIKSTEIKWQGATLGMSDFSTAPFGLRSKWQEAGLRSEWQEAGLRSKWQGASLIDKADASTRRRLQKKEDDLKSTWLLVILVLLCLFFGELVFANWAKRTYEIIWKILKGCSCRNSSLRYSYGRIILPTANITNILFHNS